MADELDRELQEIRAQQQDRHDLQELQDDRHYRN
jgi:hypothetical protein